MSNVEAAFVVAPVPNRTLPWIRSKRVQNSDAPQEGIIKVPY